MTGGVYNRDKFLAKIASQMGRHVQTEAVEKPVMKGTIAWHTLADKSNDELLAIFIKQCELIHTKVLTSTKADLFATIQSEIDQFAGGEIIITDDDRFHQYDLQSPLISQNKTYIWGTEVGRININKAEAANVGICFAEYALAESGTVVTASNSGHGRAFDMLPKHFITIIEKERLVPRSTQAAFDINQRAVNGEQVPTALHFISGPSNSADIEMELVVGVHGPLKMTYIVI